MHGERRQHQLQTFSVPPSTETRTNSMREFFYSFLRESGLIKSVNLDTEANATKEKQEDYDADSKEAAGKNQNELGLSKLAPELL